MRKAFSTLFALVGLAGCASASSGARDPGGLLLGAWDNSAQMARAPETLKRPPTAGGAYEWLDSQYAIFWPVYVPALSGGGVSVWYLEWRSGSPTGPISRQRLWVFRPIGDGQTVMDFYAFKTPQAFEAAVGPSEAFKALTLDDLTAYGPQCALPVVTTPSGWQAAIPSTCSITARSGRAMVLSAQIVVDGNTLRYSEQGVLPSGALAFKVPGGPPYQFVRSAR
jgi:CpeT/CpcT family (DUF1001)